jgi:hypothetical protein
VLAGVLASAHREVAAGDYLCPMAPLVRQECWCGERHTTRVHSFLMGLNSILLSAALDAPTGNGLGGPHKPHAGMDPQPTRELRNTNTTKAFRVNIGKTDIDIFVHFFGKGFYMEFHL